MFSTALRDGKAFAAEQKIRELKKRMFRLYWNKKHLNEIIMKATDNINSIPTLKYGILPEAVEKNL